MSVQMKPADNTTLAALAALDAVQYLGTINPRIPTPEPFTSTLSYPTRRLQRQVAARPRSQER